MSLKLYLNNSIFLNPSLNYIFANILFLQELNGYLSDRTYFAGPYLTLADLSLYYGLHRTFVSFSTS